MGLDAGTGKARDVFGVTSENGLLEDEIPKKPSQKSFSKPRLKNMTFKNTKRLYKADFQRWEAALTYVVIRFLK